MNPKSVIVRCSNCGTKNRIPENRLQENPVCGRCRSPLPIPGAAARPVEVTDQTFNREVLSYGGAVLLDCWAPWCGPCRTVAPVLDQLAQEYAGRIRIAKLNVDENPMTASRFQIQSIPTMLLFKNGAPVDRLVGALPKREIERHLAKVL